MKRKLLTLVALVAVLCLSLVGCKLWFESYTEISIVEAPKTQYTVGETKDGVQIVFKAVDKVSGKEDTITVTFNDNGDFIVKSADGQELDHKLVTVNGFNLSKPGSFTATVTYDDATASFDYTVVTLAQANGFAGGTGTQSDPYLVSNASEFANIVLKAYEGKWGYTYYKLVSDIDFSGVDIGSMTASDGKTYNQIIDTGLALYPKEPLYSFCGQIDGSAGAVNFKLKNFQATFENVSLFGNIADGTFTNIDVVGFNTVGYRTGAFGSNAYYDVNGETYGGNVNVKESLNGGGKVTFKNVNILEGNKLAHGGYLTQAKKAYSVVFEDCTMAGDVMADGDNVGGFVGASTDSRLVSFKNCTMAGNVTGLANTGGLIGYASDTKTAEPVKRLSFTNCLINGTIKLLSDHGVNDEKAQDRDCSVVFNSKSEAITDVTTAIANGNVKYGDNFKMTVNGTNDDYKDFYDKTTSKDYANDYFKVSSTGTITAGEGLTDELKTSIAYYRVMYQGNVDHYVKDKNSGYYVKHFSGGWYAPLAEAGTYYSLTELQAATVKIVSTDGLKSQVPEDASIVVKEWVWNDESYGIDDGDTQCKYSGSDISELGTFGDLIVFGEQTDGRFVYTRGYDDRSKSLLIYKGTALAITVVGYNENGEPIAAHRQAMKMRSDYSLANTKSEYEAETEKGNSSKAYLITSASVLVTKSSATLLNVTVDASKNYSYKATNIPYEWGSGNKAASDAKNAAAQSNQ